MILALWLTLTPTFALDINDHLSLKLAGGEQVDGWYLRPEAHGLVVSIPMVGETAHIPMSIVESVTINKAPMILSDFQAVLTEAWAAHTRWLTNPPPHPPPLAVVVPSLVLAGSGHAMLGEWELAAGMLISDAVFMGVMGVEAAGLGTGRMDVFLSAAVLSVLFKAYGMSDAHRLARRRRIRMGLDGRHYEKSPS